MISVFSLYEKTHQIDMIALSLLSPSLLLSYNMARVFLFTSTFAVSVSLVLMEKLMAETQHEKMLSMTVNTKTT